MTGKQPRKIRRDTCGVFAMLIGAALLIFSLGTLFGVCLDYAAADKPSLAGDLIAEASASARSDFGSIIEANIVTYDGVVLPEGLADVFVNACETYNVPCALALAIAEKESDFNPDAVSKSGDYGLMQINKVNFDWLAGLGIDPLTYDGNIEAGVLILSQKIEKYGDFELALMAYNCGDTGAKRLWNAGTYSTCYSSSVMELYRKWQNLLGTM